MYHMQRPLGEECRGVFCMSHISHEHVKHCCEEIFLSVHAVLSVREAVETGR